MRRSRSGSSLSQPAGPIRGVVVVRPVDESELYSSVPGMGVASRLGMTDRMLDSGIPACSAEWVIAASRGRALWSSRAAVAA